MNDSPRRKIKTPSIDRAEWDFSKCPPKELMLCCCYEYCRSSLTIREEYFKAVEETDPSRRSKEYLRLSTGYGLSLHCPEFPDTPWLKIASKTRLKRVRRLIKFGQTAFTPADPRQSLSFNEQTGDEVAMFEISWGCTKTKIVEDFKRWVKDNHPHKQKAICGEDAIWPERLGSTARGMLNALAAWRLRQRMTWSEAAELTANESGEALFENQSRWITAKGDAEFLLFPSKEGGEVISG